MDPTILYFLNFNGFKLIIFQRFFYCLELCCLRALPTPQDDHPLAFPASAASAASTAFTTPAASTASAASAANAAFTDSTAWPLRLPSRPPPRTPLPLSLSPPQLLITVFYFVFICFDYLYRICLFCRFCLLCRFCRLCCLY